MRQRNVLCTGQMIDHQMDQQGSGDLHPDPCTILGGVTNVLHPNIHAIMPASGTSTNFDIHHLPEHYGSAIYYGMTPYNGAQQHQSAANANLDLGVTAASNYYNSYMTPSSGSGAFSSSRHHGSSEHLPSVSNHGVIGVPTDYYEMNVSTNEYGRNNYFMDAGRGSCKRKNAEGFPGNFQHFDASASSSSSVAFPNTSHPELGVTVMDAESFSLFQYGGTGRPAIMEVGHHRGVSSRLGSIGLESVTPQNHNHLLVHGNYLDAFQRAGSIWRDQQQGSIVGDGSILAWNQAPDVIYLANSNVNGGSVEIGNMCLQRSHEISNNRGSTTYLHPPPFRQPHQNFNHPPPPPHSQVMRGQNINFYPQMAASSFRHPINNTPNRMVNPRDGVETIPRHPGSVPPTGIRILRPHHGRAEATPRHNNLPYLRVLPAEEVAMLEIPEYHEIGNYIDQHTDMRLDIEEMSYEELLALGERIGNVNTGLSEESIRSNLKIRIYSLPAAIINLEEEPCIDHESDVCIICQSDYENQEKIGTLDCGHEYHAECLKKWLLVKNVCPICKSSALTAR